MVFNFLTPISEEVLSELENLSQNCVGNNVLLYRGNDFPDLSDVKIAIFGILDNRGFLKKSENYTINHIRTAFYNLFPGNWDFKIADIGDVPVGESVTDTYFVVKNLVEELINANIIPIVIGGSQDMVFPIYRAFDVRNKLINYVSIDSKLDFHGEKKMSADSYLTKMVLDEPSNLFNFANIGFQTYLNSQNEIEIIDTLNFDAYRLGEITLNIHLAEPIIRDASIVSIDMRAIKSTSSGNFSEFIPNGFDGKEICVLSRYAGISENVSCFGIFNQFGSKSESTLISQMIWYFIEGVQHRSYEDVTVNNSNFRKYIVPLDELELIFYKSLITDRWWIELNNNSIKNLSKIDRLMIPCSMDDYQNALNGNVPERWWKLLRKSVL
jgi:hypothetical protein